jgi:hypothetical protein
VLLPFGDGLQREHGCRSGAAQNFSFLYSKSKGLAERGERLHYPSHVLSAIQIHNDILFMPNGILVVDFFLSKR